MAIFDRFDREKFEREYMVTWETRVAVFTRQEVKLLVANGFVTPDLADPLMKLSYNNPPESTTTFDRREIRFLLDAVNKLNSAQGGS